MKKLIFTAVSAIMFNSIYAQSVTTPYTTGFDSPPEQNGWQEFRTGFNSTYKWGYSGAEFNTAPNSVSHDYPVGGNANDTVTDWFVSPPFTINGDVYISFESRIYSISGGTTPTDHFGLWYSIGEPDPVKGTFQPLMDLTNEANSGGNWKTYDTTLNGISNDSVYFAFKYSATQNWFVINFDDIFLMPAAGMKENVLENQLTVYPQPANDKINFQCENALVNANFCLYDISGREISKTTHVQGNNFSIETDIIPTGLYLYRLSEGSNEITTGRLSVQH